VEGAAFTDIEDVVPFVKWLDDELSYLVPFFLINYLVSYLFIIMFHDTHFLVHLVIYHNSVEKTVHIDHIENCC